MIQEGKEEYTWGKSPSEIKGGLKKQYKGEAMQQAGEGFVSLSRMLAQLAEGVEGADEEIKKLEQEAKAARVKMADAASRAAASGSEIVRRGGEAVVAAFPAEKTPEAKAADEDAAAAKRQARARAEVEKSPAFKRSQDILARLVERSGFAEKAGKPEEAAALYEEAKAVNEALQQLLSQIIDDGRATQRELRMLRDFVDRMSVKQRRLAMARP